MKIILTENIKGLGQIGETLEVKHGYARNFLVPKKLAILATAENLKKIDELKKLKNLEVQREIEKMKEVTGKLKDFRLLIETRADEKGNLYAAVTSKKIGESLRERGIEINPDYIEITFNQIKKAGVHQALFKYYDIETKFEVEVIGI
ncbi:MAG: 50S ribosomal protein L9 [Patescibacteria group bacterium]